MHYHESLQLDAALSQFNPNHIFVAYSSKIDHPIHAFSMHATCLAHMTVKIT